MWSQLTKSSKPQFNYILCTQRRLHPRFFSSRANKATHLDLKSFSLLAYGVTAILYGDYTIRLECVPRRHRTVTVAWEKQKKKSKAISRVAPAHKWRRINWSDNIICNNLLSCVYVCFSWRCLRFFIICAPWKSLLSLSSRSHSYNSLLL